MGFLKGKTLQERAEDEKAKLQMSQMKLAKTTVDNKVREQEARKRQLELKRLMA